MISRTPENPPLLEFPPASLNGSYPRMLVSLPISFPPPLLPQHWSRRPSNPTRDLTLVWAGTNHRSVRNCSDLRVLSLESCFPLLQRSLLTMQNLWSKNTPFGPAGFILRVVSPVVDRRPTGLMFVRDVGLYPYKRCPGQKLSHRFSPPCQGNGQGPSSYQATEGKKKYS